jgi:hypothetical protein
VFLASDLLAVEPQPVLVPLVHRLEGFHYLLVAMESLADLGNLLGAEADLARLGAGVIDVEDPERVSFAASAFEATGGMKSGELEQGAAEELLEGGGEAVSFADGLLVYHLYR